MAPPLAAVRLHRVMLLTSLLIRNDVRFSFLQLRKCPYHTQRKSHGYLHTDEVCAIELLEFPKESPIANRSGGVTVTPSSSSPLIFTGN